MTLRFRYLFSLIVGLSLSGCLLLVEKGRDDGERCDDDDYCKKDSFCNTRGTCMPKGSCYGALDCARTQVCLKSDASGAEYTSTETGQCTAEQCLGDFDCEGAAYCEDRMCTTDCDSAAACKVGHVCTEAGACALPEDAPQASPCASNLDCSWNVSCIEGQCRHHACSNCPEGYECSGERCVVVGASPTTEPCPTTNDGVCDEPVACPSGSDAVDCAQPEPSSNSCTWALDGECDEPEFCAPGTDSQDCGY